MGRKLLCFYILATNIKGGTILHFSFFNLNLVIQVRNCHQYLETHEANEQRDFQMIALITEDIVIIDKS